MASGVATGSAAAVPVVTERLTAAWPKSEDKTSPKRNTLDKRLHRRHLEKHAPTMPVPLDRLPSSQSGRILTESDLPGYWSGVHNRDRVGPCTGFSLRPATGLTLDTMAELTEKETLRNHGQNRVRVIAFHIVSVYRRNDVCVSLAALDICVRIR